VQVLIFEQANFNRALQSNHVLQTTSNAHYQCATAKDQQHKQQRTKPTRHISLKIGHKNGAKKKAPHR